METADLTELKERAARGFAWSFAWRLLCEMLQFGTGVVLARLLMPGDFGLLAMVAAFAGVGMAFRSLGIATALLRPSELDDELFSSAFWLNLLCGTSLAICLFFSASPISRFYGEPMVRPLCRLAALNFAISSVGICHAAVHTRRLDYRTLGSIQAAGRVLFACVSIPLALRSWGAFSLVWGAIAENLLVLLLTAYLARQPVSFRLSWRRVLPLVQFGGWVVGGQLVKRVQDNVTLAIVGRFAGKSPLAMFKKAFTTSTMPVRHLVWSVTDVLLPSMAKLAPGSAGIQEMQIRSLRIVALLTFPACVGMAVVANPFIVGIYGEKWAEAVAFLRIFCGVTMLFCIQHQLQSALIAVGRANRLFWVLGFAAACQWLGVALGYRLAGVQGLLAGVVVAKCAEFFLVSRLCLRETRTTVAAFLGALAPPFALAVVMGAGVFASRRAWLGDMALLLDLAVSSSAGICLYVLLLLTFRPAAVRDAASVFRRRIEGHWLAQNAVLRRTLDYCCGPETGEGETGTEG